MTIYQLLKLRHKLLCDLLNKPLTREAVEDAIKESLLAYNKYRVRENDYQYALRTAKPEIAHKNHSRLRKYRRKCPKQVTIQVCLDGVPFYTIVTTAETIRDARHQKSYYCNPPAPKHCKTVDKVITHAKSELRKLGRSPDYANPKSELRKLGRSPDYANPKCKVTVKSTAIPKMTQKEFFTNK